MIFYIFSANQNYRYNPANDGKYHPSNDGKYNADNGRYVHQDVKYEHVVGGTGGSGGSGGGGGSGDGAPAAPKYRPTAPKATPVVRVAPPVTAAPRRIVNVPAQPPTGWRTIRYDDDIDTSGYHYL